MYVNVSRIDWAGVTKDQKREVKEHKDGWAIGVKRVKRVQDKG